MMGWFIGVIAVLTTLVSPAGSAESPKPHAPLTSYEQLSFKERCLVATVLAREMRDVLSWVDPRRLPGVMGDDGFNLLLVAASGGEIRSLFKAGEKCSVSIDRYFPSAGKMEVQLAEDPPPLLPAGRSYALLLVKDLVPGSRWQFEWNLGDVGYSGCQAEGKQGYSSADSCRHPTFTHGLPMPDVRIVVRRHGSRFDAEAASLDVAKWSSSPPHTQP